MDLQTRLIQDKLKLEVERICSSYISIHGKKKKNDRKESNLKYNALKEMMAILEDQEFQYQLKLAKPGTKHLINSLIMHATQNELTNIQFQRNQTLKVGDEVYSQKASAMLLEFKNALERLVKIQMTSNNKSKQKNLNFYQIFKQGQESVGADN